MVVKRAVLSDHWGCLQPLLCPREACRLPALPFWLQDNHLLLTRCWLLELNSEYIRF